MKILITGGAGFVGSNLAMSLKEHDERNSIVVFDNLRRRGSELNVSRLKQRGIRFIHGDIRCASDLEELGEKFDIFIEASAEPSVLAGITGSPHYVIQTNLVGTLNCLEFCRRHCGMLVFLSSSKVYSIAPLRELKLSELETRFEFRDSAIVGASPKGIAESFPTNTARSFYGATKLASEQLIQEYSYSYGLKSVINRCGVICGPGQFGKVDQGAFALWVIHHYFGKPLSYLGFGGLGKQVRDLLHPTDLFNLMMKQLSHPEMANGDIFNVGGGNENAISLCEFTRICQEVTAREVPVDGVDKSVIVDVPFYVSDLTKASRVFGWSPRIPVKKIVEDTWEWIKSNTKSLETLFQH